MTWHIEWRPKAEKDFNSLDKPIKERIKEYLEERVLEENPRRSAEPLHGEKSGLWRYQVGKYRVVVEFIDHTMVILVVDVGHRKDIYKNH